MNAFERFLQYLNSIRMTTPPAWGSFHLACLGISFALVALFIIQKSRGKMIPENTVFGLYGFVTLALEVAKQLMWSVHFDGGVAHWGFSWYSAPFQYCTMPMYLCIILCFVKNKTVRSYLLSFLGFFSIVSMVLVMAYPSDCLCAYAVINVHTMYMHCGGFVVAMYVLINRLTDYSVKSVLRGAAVFAILAAIALGMDILVEKSGINCGDTFNMFYISPYYECSLPVLSGIWKKVAYPVFLAVYMFSMCLGATVTLMFACGAAEIKALLLKKHKLAV